MTMLTEDQAYDLLATISDALGEGVPFILLHKLDEGAVDTGVLSNLSADAVTEVLKGMSETVVEVTRQ